MQRVWSRARWASLRFSRSSSTCWSALALVMLSSVSASLCCLVAFRLSCSTETHSRLTAWRRCTGKPAGHTAIVEEGSVFVADRCSTVSRYCSHPLRRLQLRLQGRVLLLQALNLGLFDPQGDLQQKHQNVLVSLVSHANSQWANISNMVKDSGPN